MEAIKKLKESFYGSDIVQENIIIDSKEYRSIDGEKLVVTLNYFDKQIIGESDIIMDEIYQRMTSALKNELFNALFRIEFGDSGEFEYLDDYLFEKYFIENKQNYVTLTFGNITISDNITNIDELKNMLDSIFVSYINYIILNKINK